MKNSDTETIGDRIKLVRELLGHKQESFASFIGVSASYISKIENGKKVPSKAIIKSISRASGVRELWLESGSGPTPLDDTGSSEMLQVVERRMSEAIRRSILDNFELFSFMIEFFTAWVLEREISDIVKYLSALSDKKFADDIIGARRRILDSIGKLQGALFFQEISKLNEERLGETEKLVKKWGIIDKNWTEKLIERLSVFDENQIEKFIKKFHDVGGVESQNEKPKVGDRSPKDK